MKKEDPYRELISKPEISFWVPIVFTAVSITMSFMLLSNKVDLVIQRQIVMIDNQNTIIVKYEDVQKRLGALEKSVAVLQTKQEIKN